MQGFEDRQGDVERGEDEEVKYLGGTARGSLQVYSFKNENKPVLGVGTRITPNGTPFIGKHIEIFLSQFQRRRGQ